MPGDHFIKDDAQRIQVGTGIGIDGLPAGLFRRHVVHRPQHIPQHGHLVRFQVCQPPVANLDLRPVPVEQDIFRLDIPVENTFLVCHCQPAADRLENANLFGERRQRAFRFVHPVQQRSAIHVFHYNVVRVNIRIHFRFN